MDFVERLVSEQEGSILLPDGQTPKPGLEAAWDSIKTIGQWHYDRLRESVGNIADKFDEWKAAMIADLREAGYKQEHIDVLDGDFEKVWGMVHKQEEPQSPPEVEPPRKNRRETQTCAQEGPDRPSPSKRPQSKMPSMRRVAQVLLVVSTLAVLRYFTTHPLPGNQYVGVYPMGSNQSSEHFFHLEDETPERRDCVLRHKRACPIFRLSRQRLQCSKGDANCISYAGISSRPCWICYPYR